LIFGNKKKQTFKRSSYITKASPVALGPDYGVKYGNAKYSSFENTKKETGSSKVNIYCWNINGINARINDGKLKEFFRDANPDIICINETKTDIDKIDKSFQQHIPEEYEQYWNSCKIKKGYSGVAIYTKIAPISVRQDIGVEEHDQEGRVLTLEFEKFFVVTSYTPNAGDGLKRVDYRTKQWDVDFFKYLQTLEKEGKAVILGGDLNVAHKDIDMFNPYGQDFVAGFTPQEKNSFNSLLTDCKFVDTFRHFYPTEVKYSVW